MSALLLKDYYVIFRQMKIFLLLILVFSCIPGTFYSTVAVVYDSMMPYPAPWHMKSVASGTRWLP